MSLRIIPIVCPGEEIKGKDRLEEFGYDIQPHLASLLDDSPLTDTYPEEKIKKWLGDEPELKNTQFVRSLRASWYNVLMEHLSEPDTTIFAEADAWPCDKATSEALEALLKDKLLPIAEQQGYDVIRLFNDCYDSFPNEDIHLEDIEWKNWITPVGEVSYDMRSMGTHALVIPLESRRKIARLFSTIKLPTDAALEYAAQMGMIRVLTADKNIFMQKTKRKDDIPGKAYAGIMRRFLVCMSSYKRPFDLMRQVYTFMDQTYDLYHMSVIVRGVSEHDFIKFILPSLRHFIEEGRLTLQLAPNRSCLANTIECFLGHNLGAYDYVCKVDDDDWYSRDYLFAINNFLNYVGDNVHGVYNSKQGYEIQLQNGIPVWKKNDQRICENTFAIPVKIANQLVAIYKREKGAVGLSTEYSPSEDKNGVVWGDGLLIRRLFDEQGCCDIGEFAEKNLPFLSVVNKTNCSFLRKGNYIPDAQRYAAVDTGNFRDVPEECIVKLDNDTYQIIGHRIENVEPGKHGSVIIQENGVLAITWDSGENEKWEKQKDGSYSLCDSD